MGSPRHKHQPMSEEEVVTYAYVQENMIYALQKNIGGENTTLRFENQHWVKN